MKFLLKKNLIAEKNKFSILLIILVLNLVGNAQVINVESKRFLNDTNGWVGKTEANFTAVQNTQQIITVGLNVHIQYQRNRHRILEISDLAFVKAGNKDFVNSGYQHLRYNYKINSLLTFEAFAQAQYNKALRLDERYLAGIGPRVKLIKQKHFRCYLAALYVYEHQWQANYEIERADNRVSSYLTFSFFYNHFDLTSTTFYQPNISDIEDYRIANDTSFEIVLNSRFNFKTGVILLFDTRQPPGVPDLTYIMKNGISYKF